MIAIYILCALGALINAWLCHDYIKATKGRLPGIPFISALMFCLLSILV